MAITLTYAGSTLNLHPDLLWADEFAWSPVSQSAERSVTGALLLQYGTKLSGRPITLQPETPDSAWTSRETLNTLNSWASVAGREMTLSIYGTDFQVVFRHLDSAIDASPVVHYGDIQSADWYSTTLRFMEI